MAGLIIDAQWVKENYHGEEIFSIPDGVIGIQANAFNAMTDEKRIFFRNLKSVTIPDSVVKIGATAFYCSPIESITIPNSVTEIGAGAFAQCHHLKNIILSNNIKEIKEETFSFCGINNVIIPDSVTKIGKEAFESCYITNIHLPNSLEEIGQRAFQGCSLPTISIPKSVTKIGAGAFKKSWENRNYFESIVIPEGVTEIEDSTFKGCYNLKSVTIPESVTKIGSWVFEGCENLKSFACCKDSYAERYAKRHGYEVVYSKELENKKLQKWADESPLYAEIHKTLDSSAVYFNSDKADNKAIPDLLSAYEIGKILYAKNTDEKNALLSECKDEKIKKYVDTISNCKTTAYNKHLLVFLKNGQVFECDGNVIKHDDDNIYLVGKSYSEKTYKINLAGKRHYESEMINGFEGILGVEELPSYFYQEFDENGRTFDRGRSNDPFIIPFTSGSIIEGNRAKYWYCDNVGEGGEEDSQSLTLTYYIKITDIDKIINIDLIQQDLNKHLIVKVDKRDVIDYVLGNYDYANKMEFDNNIGNYTDYFKQLLNHFEESQVCKIDGTTLVFKEGITNIDRINLPDTISETITKVILPCSTKAIEKKAFADYKSLETIVIPNGVEIIGREAFARCYSLNKINIPDSVSSIGAYAFGDCVSLALSQSNISENYKNQLESDIFINCGYIIKEFESFLTSDEEQREFTDIGGSNLTLKINKDGVGASIDIYTSKGKEIGGIDVLKEDFLDTISKIKNGTAVVYNKFKGEKTLNELIKSSDKEKTRK